MVRFALFCEASETTNYRRDFMMRAYLALVFLTAVGAAQAQPDTPKLIRLAPQSTAKQVGDFHYRLLPDPLDRTAGNSVPLWRLAGEAARNAKRRLTLKEDAWLTVPLPELPRKEVADFLAHHTVTFHLARQAACRDHCDWERPPLTLQMIQVSFSNELIQRLRELIQLLSIRCRLQIAEGRYEDAAESLQIGFAMARHLCDSDSAINNLVGVAIASIMVHRVEEWVQTPGSPNLYWALTALPRPLTNLRRTYEQELEIIPRSFPALRRLRRETLTVRQAEELVKEVCDELGKVAEGSPKEEENRQEFRKLRASIMAAEAYPQARQHLLDLGRPAKYIDAMPKAQVILLRYLNQYDRSRDDVLKAVMVPTWQAIPLLDAATQEYRAAGKGGNPLFALMMINAVMKSFEAHIRLERYIAGLRAAEALRFHAAAHAGKPPAKWDDITAVPLPLDPITGRGFRGLYQVKDGRGILNVPFHRSGMPASLGRRYELAPQN
jgi:hypothetical protein